MLYLIWSKCDDLDDMLVGVATTREKANQMIVKLEESFEDAFDYEVIPFEKNQVTINDKKYHF